MRMAVTRPMRFMSFSLGGNVHDEAPRPSDTDANDATSNPGTRIDTTVDACVHGHVKIVEGAAPARPRATSSGSRQNVLVHTPVRRISSRACPSGLTGTARSSRHSRCDAGGNAPRSPTPTPIFVRLFTPK